MQWAPHRGAAAAGEHPPTHTNPHPTHSPPPCAQVYDTPGSHVTRDYKEGIAQLGDLRFRVVDTSGLEPAAAPGSLLGRAAALTLGVLRRSEAALVMLDARWGARGVWRWAACVACLLRLASAV